MWGFYKQGKAKRKQTHNRQCCQTVNAFGDQGECALSEALKVNTRLATLDLESAEKTNAMPSTDTVSTTNKAGNGIGSEGAKALSEALKINSALTTLNLRSVHY